MDEQPNPTKDKLLADMKVVVNDAEELLRATASQAGEKIDNLRERVATNLASAKEHLASQEFGVMDRARAAAHAADEYVHQNPWAAVGIAAGAAFVLGLLLGRR